MLKLTLSILLLSLLALSFAEPSITLDQEKANTLNKELVQAMKDKDLSFIQKYMYSGSKITIDLDTSDKKGEKKITYDKYLDLTRRTIVKMGKSDVDVKLLSLSIDKEKNQITIKSKIKILTHDMGRNFKFVSTKKTLLGIVDNEIKIISSKDHLISINSL